MAETAEVKVEEPESNNAMADLSAAWDKHEAEIKNEEKLHEEKPAEGKPTEKEEVSDVSSTDKDGEGVEAGAQAEAERGKPEVGEVPSDADAGGEVKAEVEKAGSAPVGWRAGAREHWGKLPKEVRDEVNRREQDINMGMQRNSEAAQRFAQIDKVIAPFRSLFAPRGVTDAQAVHAVMDTAARLQQGSPMQKAQQVADIIKEYSVDVGTLDNLLSGEPLEPGMVNQSAIDAAVQQAVAPYRDYVNQQQQTQSQQRQQIETSVNSEVDKFAMDPKNEFYNDVAADMADLLDLAHTHGREITLQQAYERACAARPDISKVVSGRQMVEDIDKKKAVAVSVVGDPAGAIVAEEPDTLRGALDKAWNEQGVDGPRM